MIMRWGILTTHWNNPTGPFFHIVQAKDQQNGIFLFQVGPYKIVGDLSNENSSWWVGVSHLSARPPLFSPLNIGLRWTKYIPLSVNADLDAYSVWRDRPLRPTHHAKQLPSGLDEDDDTIFIIKLFGYTICANWCHLPFVLCILICHLHYWYRALL